MRWLCFVVVCSTSPLIFAHDDHAPKAPAPEIVHQPSVIPDRIVLTWAGDPQTMQAITWRTSVEVKAAFCQHTLATGEPLFYGKEASAAFREKVTQTKATTTVLKSDLGEAHYHAVHLVGLQPGTKYAFRVGDGVNWSEWSHFDTARAEPAPFSFVYFGDAQNDIKSHWSRVVREAFRDAPRAAFFIHAGDLVNKGESDAVWGEWFYSSGFIHRMIPAVPTPGNHEYSTVDDTKRLTPHWRAMFTLPDVGIEGLAETVYSFDYQGARIIALNSNVNREEQTVWLKEQLANNPQRWTVVTFHHPIYSSAKGRDNKDLRDLWQPLFDEYHVDLVLQGHDHGYARSRLLTAEDNLETGVTHQSDKGGTVYVVSVSGPKMYAVENRPLFRSTAANTQLYQIITIDGNQLRYEARTASGSFYDGFQLHKRPGLPNLMLDATMAPDKEAGQPAAIPDPEAKPGATGQPKEPTPRPKTGT